MEPPRMDPDRLWIGAKERTPDDFRRLRAEAARLVAERPVGGDDVRATCLFVGYPRSGHSLVGSLLDAHPEIVLAHELDLLDFVDRGFSRDELVQVIVENSRRFSEHGREWTGYDYEVPGQWQGRHSDLRVVGDKKGGRSIRRLHDDPALAERLEALLGVPLRFVHVVRNPWDNVATRSRRKADQDITLLADRHFALVRRVAKLKERQGAGSVLDIRHEDLIADAPGTLARVCAFLGLDAPAAWVSAAAGIVYVSPRRSRDEVEWPAGLVESIRVRAADVDFLRDYTFED